MENIFEKVVLVLELLLPPKADLCNTYGKVRVVQTDADYKVFIKDTKQKADLDVAIVNDEPDQPGEWKIVKIREDYTIKIVKTEAEADFTIRFVPYAKGCKK